MHNMSIRGTKGRGHGSVIPMEIVALFTEALRLPPGHSCRLRFESWRRCRDAVWWASQLKRLYWEHMLAMPGLSPVWLAIHMQASPEVIQFLGHEPKSLTKRCPHGTENMPYYLVIERVATSDIQVLDSEGEKVAHKSMEEATLKSLAKHRSWLQDNLGKMPLELRQRLQEAETTIKNHIQALRPLEE